MTARLLLPFLALAPAVVSAAPTVSVLPASVLVTNGDEFEIAVECNAEVGDLSCFSITVDFDDAILNIVSHQEGALFASAGDPTYYEHGSDGSGDDVFSACVLGYGTSVSSPGELFRIRFKAIDDGTTPITLASVTLRDPDRAVIGGVVVEHGNASVSLTGTPPPPSLFAFRLVPTPNPAGAATSFDLVAQDAEKADEAARLLREGELELFDLRGRRVALSAPGRSTGRLRWDGRDQRGNLLPSGSYVAALRVNGAIVSRALLVRLR